MPATSFNVLPAAVEVAELAHQSVAGRLMLTDGKSYSLDINEFGADR